MQLRLEEADRDDPGTISRLYVPSEAGGLVRVDNLIDIDPAITASRIDRLDRQRQVSLRAAVAPGYALADRIDVLRAAVEQMNLPPAYNTYISGGGRELERTFTEFLWAFALSLVAGMPPLVLGAGAEERRAVAVVVIGGLSLSLFLTLLVVPVAYAALASLPPETSPKPL